MRSVITPPQPTAADIDRLVDACFADARNDALQFDDFVRAVERQAIVIDALMVVAPVVIV
jgi:hypothetical protein